MSWSITINGHIEDANAAPEEEQTVLERAREIVAALRGEFGDSVKSGSFSGQHAGYVDLFAEPTAAPHDDEGG